MFCAGIYTVIACLVHAALGHWVVSQPDASLGMWACNLKTMSAGPSVFPVRRTPVAFLRRVAASRRCEATRVVAGSRGEVEGAC